MQGKIYLLLLFLFIASGNILDAQGKLTVDTVSLSISDAENEFLQKNFQLLISKYQVSEAEAAVVQAKLWDNPTLSVDQGAYNPDNKKWFDFSPNGETAVSLEQLIHLAGQHSKNVKLQKINQQLSSYQFFDLIRNLKYELRTSFYSLYFLRQSLSVYDQEIESLKILIDAYDGQYHKGNVSFSELARLHALQFSLENERIDIVKEISEKQNNLSVLTGDTLARPLQPVLATAELDTMDISNLNYVQLLDSGFTNRYDLKESLTQVEEDQANLSLQKSLRVPDMHLSANWDKAGSYIYNYNSVGVSIDLPFFNRNQGNIKIATYKVEESKLMSSKAELEVKNDISKAFVQLAETDKLYKSAYGKFNDDYDKLLGGITKGYQNHTISLVEFIDYYEAYKNSKIEFNKLQNNLLEAKENMNLAVGTKIFK